MTIDEYNVASSDSASADRGLFDVYLDRRYSFGEMPK